MFVKTNSMLDYTYNKPECLADSIDDVKMLKRTWTLIQ